MKAAKPSPTPRLAASKSTSPHFVRRTSPPSRKARTTLTVAPARIHGDAVQVLLAKFQSGMECSAVVPNDLIQYQIPAREAAVSFEYVSAVVTVIVSHVT